MLVMFFRISFYVKINITISTTTTIKAILKQAYICLEIQGYWLLNFNVFILILNNFIYYDNEI